MAEDVLHEMNPEELMAYAEVQDRMNDCMEKLILAKDEVIDALEKLVVSREYEAAKTRAYREQLKKMQGRRKLMAHKYEGGQG
jgi:hypothetical protein